MRSYLLFLHIMGVVLALGLRTGSAEPAYLDDRSTPEMLIRSLYNAVNRKEYARAYSYFGTPPAPSVEAYAKGYEDTESVEVVTGTATADGAAGSIFYSLPVAIRARNTDGEERTFAGCYTFRFVQPSVQTTPYKPLLIESGKLEEGEPAEGALEDLLPPSCGDGEKVQTNPMLQKAGRLFDAVFSEECRGDDSEEPESHKIQFNYSYEEAGATPKEAQLFRFFCDRGAYNELHAYILANEDGELAPLRFAVPELDIRYENDDPDGAVEEMRIIGYKTEALLVNSQYDPHDMTISSHAKWRGIGDAFSNGTWLFRSGTFSLVHYDVDASYDGEIDPETMVDYLTGP